MSQSTIERRQLAYDTAANWTAQNPILAVAEIGYETDTGKQKIGNGVTAWNSLAYQVHTSGNGGGAFSVGALTATGETRLKDTSGMLRIRTPAGGISYLETVNLVESGYQSLTIDASTTILGMQGSVLVGTQSASTGAKLEVAGSGSFTGTTKTGGYTVSTLPSAATGERAYVTDATAPTFGGALTGGGAIVIPVIKNATAWVAA